GGDGRQLLAQGAVLVAQAEAGGVLKRLEGELLHLPAMDEPVELAQRIAGVDAFKVVGCAEQALPAGLPLPARDGAETVEAARDGGEESLFAADVGRNRPEQG